MRQEARPKLLEWLFPFTQIYDPNKDRFEVPHEYVSSLNNNPFSPINNTLQITQKPFDLKVRRKEDQNVVWVLIVCMCHVWLCQIGDTKENSQCKLCVYIKKYINFYFLIYFISSWDSKEKNRFWF